MGDANFKRFLQEKVKVNNRKVGNLGRGVVAIERSRSKITVTSEVRISKRRLEYLTNKYLQKDLRDWLRAVAKSGEGHELCYFQINQGEEEDEDSHSLIWHVLHELLNKTWEPKRKSFTSCL